MRQVPTENPLRPASDGTPPASATGKESDWSVGAVLGVWAFALAVLVFIRLRTSWPAYIEMHQWMADRGVPDLVRSLDYPLLMLLPVVVGAVIAGLVGSVPPGEGLFLRAPRSGWVKMMLVAGVPMVVGGFVLMLLRDNEPALADLFGGVVRAPVLEELLLRGLLVGLPLAALGYRKTVFWWFAVAGAVVFGLMHVQWSIDGLASGWPNLLVTAAGGVWYAWLMREWHSVFVPMLLHAVMNLCWFLAGSSDAGGGGPIENVLRVATIVLATVLTIRAARARGTLDNQGGRDYQ